MVEMHLPGEGHDELMDMLLGIFPESPYLLSQKAQICFQEKGSQLLIVFYPH